jgi:flagellar motility protein MotE (MotC chaperone)
MIAKLQHPAAAAGLGLVLSVGLGVGLSWRALNTLVSKVQVAAPASASTELKARGWDFWTIEIENLSNELNTERARLKKEAEALGQREARLSAEEKEFEKLRAELEAMRKQIETRVVEIAADEAKNIRTLAQTYTNLTPRGAVAILREMDDTTAVKILSLMKADVVGPIFEEMSKPNGTDTSLARRAAQLSEKLRLMKSVRTANTP